jgi:hypothetical protein
MRGRSGMSLTCSPPCWPAPAARVGRAEVQGGSAPAHSVRSWLIPSRTGTSDDHRPGMPSSLSSWAFASRPLLYGSAGRPLRGPCLRDKGQTGDLPPSTSRASRPITVRDRGRHRAPRSLSGPRASARARPIPRSADVATAMRSAEITWMSPFSVRAPREPAGKVGWRPKVPRPHGGVNCYPSALSELVQNPSVGAVGDELSSSVSTAFRARLVATGCRRTNSRQEYADGGCQHRRADGFSQGARGAHGNCRRGSPASRAGPAPFAS